MEKKLYAEMIRNVDDLSNEMNLASKRIFLFGHCNATLELADFLDSRGFKTTAILDNSASKQGINYKGADVVYPQDIMRMAGKDPSTDSVVLITSRFYASMLIQLRDIGYKGIVRKVIDYNTYAEYSLTEETILRMKKRERRGNELLAALSNKYPGQFKLFCPLNALGDIYFMSSYWKSFAEKRGIEKAVFCVTGKALADVIRLFDDYPVEVYEQKELDSMIQSAIYTKDKNCFIAHQDRPYVVNLGKALYSKKIPLDQIYCCGVFGLPADTKPETPRKDLPEYIGLSDIPEGRAVIFSPYAKSVVAIPDKVWEEAVVYFSGKGFKCYTNVIGDEKPLVGTEAVSPSIVEMRSVVERAGTFVGIRSGLCDILRESRAKKIALYPDYNYCDTKWKAIDMYHIDQFEYNLSVTEEIEWEKL